MPSMDIIVPLVMLLIVLVTTHIASRMSTHRQAAQPRRDAEDREDRPYDWTIDGI